MHDMTTIPGGGKPLQTLPVGHKPVPPHVQDDTFPLAPLLTLLSARSGLHWSSNSSTEKKTLKISQNIFSVLISGRQHWKD